MGVEYPHAPTSPRRLEAHKKCPPEAPAAILIKGLLAVLAQLKSSN